MAIKVKYFSHIHHSYESHLEDDNLENLINQAIDDLNLPDNRIKSVSMATSQAKIKGDDIAHVHDVLILYDE